MAEEITKADETPAPDQPLQPRQQAQAVSVYDRADVNIVEHSPFTSMHAFSLAQRMATVLASSTIIPDDYRSWVLKNNEWVENPAAVGNCFIALELSNRLHTSPLLIMQQVDMIYGRPALRGKLMIGLLNASKAFAHDLRYECNQLPGDDYGYRAWTTAHDGTVLYGPWITWKLVKAEGWPSRKGSKWNTMPEMMFQYRAASWFASLHAAHITLGLYESEEARDIDAIEAPQSSARVLETRLAESMDKAAAETSTALRNGEVAADAPAARATTGTRRKVKQEPAPQEQVAETTPCDGLHGGEACGTECWHHAAAQADRDAAEAEQERDREDAKPTTQLFDVE